MLRKAGTETGPLAYLQPVFFSPVGIFYINHRVCFDYARGPNNFLHYAVEFIGLLKLEKKDK